MHVFNVYFITVKKHVFMFFYLQINVLNTKHRNRLSDALFE